MSHTLLSAGIGVPIALAATFLWFLVDVSTLRRRRRPVLLVPLAVAVTAVLLSIVVARFMTYA